MMLLHQKNLCLHENILTDFSNFRDEYLKIKLTHYRVPQNNESTYENVLAKTI